MPRCRHRWVVAPPSGPMSPAVCRRCGERRSFPTAAPAWTEAQRMGMLSEAVRKARGRDG